MTWVRSTILLLCLAVAAVVEAAPGVAGRAGAQGEASAADVTAIEVGFIYNFTRFIRWPAADGRDAFVIAVADAPAMAARLAVLARGPYRVAGRPIRIEAFDRPAAVPDCSILFIGAEALDRLDDLLRQIEGRPVLAVGATPGLAQRGVAINFYRQRGRVRFEINPAALRRSGLVVDAQLYDVARIVE